MGRAKTPLIVVIALLLLAALYQMVKWGPCCKVVDPGTSLLLERKTGEERAQGHFATGRQKGVLELMGSPGRYFWIDPWRYETRIVPDIFVPAGHIAIIENKVGKPLPPGKILAEEDEMGTQRKLATPGVWRFNPHGKVLVGGQPIKAPFIEPGFVGVQTLREGSDKKILHDVLQAGYKFVNPYEIRIDPLEIGYRKWEVSVEYEDVVVDGKPVRRVKEGTGISFTLADGKRMSLDVTIIWGISPENAWRILAEYGIGDKASSNTPEPVEEKVIQPQVLSICKNAGSILTTQQFIQGQRREKFQEDVEIQLKKLGLVKGIDFLYVLVRGFHPDESIKETIQATILAHEEKETLHTEQECDTIAAAREEAERIVATAVKDFDAETTSLMETEREEGIKKAAEIKAEADKVVAALDRQAAETDAERLRIEGEAAAKAIEVKKKAEGSGLKFVVDAHGGTEAFLRATFAENFPKDMEILIRHTGQGTLWTDAGDAKDVADTKRLEQVSKEQTKEASEAAPAKTP